MRVGEWDAVLSYHLNPLTCGVAKFNHQLAERLGVRLYHWTRDGCRYPLVSIKPAEINRMTDMEMQPHVEDGPFDLLLHDRSTDAQLIRYMIAKATRIFYADELGCPSTLRGNPARGPLNVLTFGMAHKFQGVHFERLRDLLDRTEKHYTISVSTGIHEGSPWAPSFDENMRLMRGIFGDHLRVLGFLADDALAKELREVQACVLFYHPGVRANNTTLWAALDAGTPTITNLDRDSPKELQHNVNVYDLAQLTEWPDAASNRVVRYGGRLVSERYGWDRLIATLTAETSCAR